MFNTHKSDVNFQIMSVHNKAELTMCKIFTIKMLISGLENRLSGIMESQGIVVWPYMIITYINTKPFMLKLQR